MTPKPSGEPSAEKVLSVGAAQELVDEIQRLRSQLATAREALRWALGEGDDFRERREWEGAYWWRKELSERAGAALSSDPGSGKTKI